MDIQEFIHKFLSRYSFLLEVEEKQKNIYPPWATRKYIELSNALIHPDLQKELFILSLCDPESIWKIRFVIQSYFAWSYKLTTESSYSLVMYFAGEDFAILSPFSQIDGIIYYDLETEGPISEIDTYDLDAISERLRENIDLRSSFVNIKVGSSAQKTDLIWFIKRYWSDIEKLLDRPELDSKQIRQRDEAKRNILEYNLRRSKVSTTERKHVHKLNNNGIELDYDVLNTAYKQAKPVAKSSQYDFFSIASKQIEGLPQIFLKQQTYEAFIDDSDGRPFLILKNKKT
jgi:hypothetical protein